MAEVPIWRCSRAVADPQCCYFVGMPVGEEEAVERMKVPGRGTKSHWSEEQHGGGRATEGGARLRGQGDFGKAKVTSKAS